MKAILKILAICFSMSYSLANDAQNGYAVIQQDTIFGIIKINFNAGSVIIKQDSLNRMFLSGIECITLLNERRDTYYAYQMDARTTFFKALVYGKNPLIELDNSLYCVIDGVPTLIDEKGLFSIFGKRKVKEYVFVRNISLQEREGLIDLFSYFNGRY